MIKSFVSRMFSTEAKTYFHTDEVVSTEMTAATTAWMAVYRGVPRWLNGADGIITINFAKTVCSEAARLATMALGVNIEGSGRAAYLQEQTDSVLYPRLRKWVEYAAAAGTVILKPNGEGVDVITPDRFLITSCNSNKEITGVIFQDSYTIGKEFYTKLEYHRFENNIYKISNKAFLSDTADALGHEISLGMTRWADIEPEVSITQANGEALERPLYGVLVMPEANNIDLDSPLGMSLFSGAMQELEDLDIAYSRNAAEIFDSSSIELIDQALVENDFSKVRLPRHVINVLGSDASDFYQSIDRPLKTTERKEGINQLLSLAGYKCGFSAGYFVFDEKSGMATATQVEADDRRTIQLVKDIRDAIRSAMDDTIYALNVFADLYGLAPAGTYKVSYDFGDITYNEEEDRQRSYQLMIQGVIPKWYYLNKWEGLSEEDAKALVEEAQGTNRRTGLFEKEE